MKPTKELILGLREAARRLRDPRTDYSWANSTRCNCGILAQCIMGIDQDKLRQLITGKEDKFVGSWCLSSRYHICKATGLSTHVVFDQLLKAGLEVRDFETLETIPYAEGNKRNPLHVADYFDKLADGLERERSATKGEMRHD